MFFPCVAPAYTSLFAAPSSVIDSTKNPTDRRSYFKTYMTSIFHQKDPGCDYNPPSFCGGGHFSSRVKRLRDKVHHAFHGSFPFQKSPFGSYGGFSAARLLSSTVQSANTAYSPCGDLAIDDGSFGCETDADSWAFLDACSPRAFCTHSASSTLSPYVESSNYLLVTPSFTLTNCAQASRKPRVPEAAADAASGYAVNKSCAKRLADSSGSLAHSSGSSAHYYELLAESSGPSSWEPHYCGAELSHNNSSCSSNLADCYQDPLITKKVRMLLTPKVGEKVSTSASLSIALVSTSLPALDFLPLVYYGLPESEICSRG